MSVNQYGTNESSINDKNLIALQGYWFISHLKKTIYFYPDIAILNFTQVSITCFCPSTITAFSNGFHSKRVIEMMKILTALLEQFHLVFLKLTGD